MRQRALALLFLSRGVELAAVKVGVEEVNVAAENSFGTWRQSPVAAIALPVLP